MRLGRCRMRCEEFRSRLDVVLDERHSPAADPQLRSHARRCADCGQWMKTSSALLKIVGRVPLPEPTADFSIGVLKSLELECKTQREVRGRRAWAISAIATAAAVLFAFVGWRDRQAPPEPPHGNAQQYVVLDYQQFLVDAGALTSERGAWVAELAQGLKPVTSSV